MMQAILIESKLTNCKTNTIQAVQNAHISDVTDAIKSTSLFDF